MSLTKGPKAGALVPESDSALSSILENLGVLVKRYRDLDDFKSIREAVQGLSQEELVFLFCNIEKACQPIVPAKVLQMETLRSDNQGPTGANKQNLEKTGPMRKVESTIRSIIGAIEKRAFKEEPKMIQATEAAKAEPIDILNPPDTEIKGDGIGSVVKMALGLALKERIQEMANEAEVRTRVEVVMILPRKSEVLKDFPKEARFLADDFTENELHFLLERWAEQTIQAVDEIREKVRKLAPEELGVLIAHEDPMIRTMLKQWLLLLLNIPPEKISEASDDQEALENISDEGKKVKVLLTSAKSPKLDGPELVKILRDSRKDIRSILLLPSINDWQEAENAHHRLVQPLNIQKLRGVLIDCLPALGLEVGIFKDFDEETMPISPERIRQMFESAVAEKDPQLLGQSGLMAMELASPFKASMDREISIANLPTVQAVSDKLKRASLLPHLSRITPLPSIQKRISLSNGSVYRGKVDMNMGADLPDTGMALDHNLPLGKRLADMVAEEKTDQTSLFKSDKHFDLMETIVLTADEKESAIVEKEGGISYSAQDQEIHDGSENVEVLGKKLDERRLSLRLLDRENAVQILARYLTPLSLSKYSQPKIQYDSSAVKRFENNPQEYELLPSNDWTIGRDIEASSKVLGIDNLVDLMKLAIETAHPKKYREPQVVGFGNGDCKIMDELAAAYTDRKVRHLTLGRSILFNLSDLLDRSLIQDLPEEESSNFKKFNVRITHLLQRHFGRFGRLEIKLNLPDDQDRLRDYLIRLAKKDEVLGYAAGKRKTAATTGKYADDKWERLTDGEIRCFAEYVENPQAFFSKYYSAFFKSQSARDANELLGLKPRDMIFGDFRDMPELLNNCGNFITFAYSVKGFSHLEDFDYGVAFNEVAARLIPGGIMIDDGAVESHTWSHRVWELREVLRNLGENGQYRIYLIGNDKGPMSVVCQRGVQLEPGKYAFTIPEGLRTDKEEGVPLNMVNLKNYEQMWPEAALRNKLIHHIKDRIIHALVHGIVDKKLRLECTQTWRQSCLKEIDPLFNDIFEQMIASWKSRNKPRRGSIDKKDRMKLSNSKNVADLLELFEEKKGEGLDSFIGRLLLRLYPYNEKLKESA
jgi:CheY-like chemotaxis protein